MKGDKRRWLPAVSITVQPRQPSPDSSAEPCPALHVIAGSGAKIPRHQPGPDGRCRFCHTTGADGRCRPCHTTTKGDTA